LMQHSFPTASEINKTRKTTVLPTSEQSMPAGFKELLLLQRG
jgi:hypothetical protein